MVPSAPLAALLTGLAFLPGASPSSPMPAEAPGCAALTHVVDVAVREVRTRMKIHLLDEAREPGGDAGSCQEAAGALVRSPGLLLLRCHHARDVLSPSRSLFVGIYVFPLHAPGAHGPDGAHGWDGAVVAWGFTGPDAAETCAEQHAIVLAVPPPGEYRLTLRICDDVSCAPTPGGWDVNSDDGGSAGLRGRVENATAGRFRVEEAGAGGAAEKESGSSQI